MIVALLAVIGHFAALTLLASFTDVSVFSLNLATGLGLGLAIDYSLFVVSRYARSFAAACRRGRHRAVDADRGPTVVFSAGTVAISLTSLAIFPVPCLRSFAYAGVAVVPLAAVAASSSACGARVLGNNVDKFRLFKVREVADGGMWRHQADRVMRHPIPTR